MTTRTALHRITVSRLRWDPATRAYVERRVREGKARGEAIRSLKRYVVRELYPLITALDRRAPALQRAA